MDSFWRGVVLAPETGDTYCLITILPRDKANAYAASHRFSGAQLQRAAAQQAAVLGRQDPALGIDLLDQRVVAVVGVAGIHPGRAKPAFPGGLEDEPGRRHRLRPGHRCDLHHIPVGARVPGYDAAPLTTRQPSPVSGTPSDCTT